MKKIAVYIFAVFVLLAGCGNSGSGRKQGEIYGECFKDNTCNEGLLCDTENNVCIKGNTADGDAEIPDDTETPDADSDPIDNNSDPSKDEYGNLKDPKTGLIWSEKHFISGPTSLNGLVSFCENLVEGGYSDWKMPTIDELRTLIQNCPDTEPYGFCKISDDAGTLSYYDDLDMWRCACYWKDEWTQQTGEGEFIYDNGGYYSKLGDDQNVALCSSSVSDYGGAMWWVGFRTASIGVGYLDDGAVVRCVGSYSRQKQCEGLPENASWNVYSSIPQTWDGSSWQPSAAGVYNEKPSDAECRFVCNTGYKWDGSKCNLTDVKAISECGRGSPTPCRDTSNGLIWSAKAPEEMFYNDAVDYCDDLVEGGLGGWHLPTISELRTLIQNCIDTVQGGGCGVTDACLSTDCWTRSYCESHLCDHDGGGNWIDSDMYSKFGDRGEFISYSKNSDPTLDSAWCVKFDYAYIRQCSSDEKYDDPYSVRCVKSKQVRQSCKGLPENALWNSVSSILQRCDETSCQPSKVGVYNETPSETECRFKCYPGYEWDGSKCNLTNPEALSECGPESPMPCMDHSSGLVWSSKTSTSWDMLDAEDYCENLTEGGISDWHLPTISELRTLIVDCPATEPGGECGVTDDCLSKEECLTEKICSCGYNDNHIKFGYEGYYLLSSSRNGEIYHGAEGDFERVWCVYCSYAKIKECSLMWPDLNFHCVR